MKLLNYIILPGVLFFISFGSFAQVGENVFYRLENEDGLSPGNVNEIVQDDLGFIWLGTESGLNRYDGYNFKLYKNVLNDSTSLSHNHVFSILKDEDGIFWIGTLGGGLNRFDSHTGEFKRFLHDPMDPESISNDIVFKVFKDSKDNIWVSTLWGGLNLFDREQEIFIRFYHDENDSTSISSNRVSAICEDSDSNLWFGTFDSGLNLYNRENNTFLRYQADPNNLNSLNHNQIMDIIEYTPGYLLIATFGGGVNLFNISENKFRNYLNESNFLFFTEHRNVRKLFDDGKNIWIGTYNGLYKFEKNSEKMSQFIYDQNNPHSINNSKIRGLFKDKSEIVWIGTTEGVNLLDPNRKKIDFHPYDENYSKILNNRFRVPLKNNYPKIMWAGDLDSNNANNNGPKRKIYYYGNSSISKKFKSNFPVKFYEDEKRTLWVSSYDGLKYYDKNEREFKYVEYFIGGVTELGNNFVKSFYFDSKGEFWAGTLGGGLTHFNPITGEISRYIHLEDDPTSIADSRVLPIYEDSHGILWVGTYGGLNIFDRKAETFKRYTYTANKPNSISNDRIYSIFETRFGELWIGTYQGLNKYNRSEDNFESFFVEDGLADNTVYGIIDDEEGNLWVRTNQGITKFDPVHLTFKNYNYGDGLKGMESNGTIIYKNDEGKLFFGGLKGFNSFYPSQISNNEIPPDVVFTELKILDEVIQPGESEYLAGSLNEIKELKLTYKDKVFSIEFAALHYAIPSKNNYAFMLEGFRDTWTYVDANNRVASFTNLSAGEYTLHVKASNNDGIWNETGRSLKIVITPPYWETWWFRIGMVIVVLLIIFLGYEYRLQRLIEIERTRSRIARNLHDEIGGTLASIQYFVDAIRKDKNDKYKEKFLDLITASSNDAQDKIKDIIWTVNPKEDGLAKFLVKFNRYASDLLDSNGISHEIIFPNVEEDKKIEMEKRQHLWCICKETIINCVKHSESTNVKIVFQLAGNILHYSIEDNGIGFDKKKNNSGNGLNNIIFRADKLDADYNFDTNDHEGTRFYISFKI